jgi:hypothetical protein
MFYKWQLTFELNRMVDIYENEYKFTILRRALESINDENKRQFIYILVHALNDICKAILDICNDFSESQKALMIDNFFELYLKYLQRYSYFIGDVDSIFKDTYRKNLQCQIFNHWSSMVEKKSDTVLEKNFLEVFDDIHESCISKYESIFVKRLGDLKNLYRAQRGKHFDNYERMIPKEEYVKNKNRWNPEGVAFIYLGLDEEVKQYDEVINFIEKTCFEELRLKKDEYVSICKFKPVKSEGKIINLCYEDISYDEIDRKSEEFMNMITKVEINEILTNKKYHEEIRSSMKKEEVIKKIIEKEINEKQIRSIIRKETEIYLANLIMKSIDEAVFLPVDTEEDPELKAYVPFHYLANYLISKGYSGILYRSTRMNKIGLKGKNLVLFNKEDVTYVPDSMNVYYYDGRKYKKVFKDIEKLNC